MYARGPLIWLDAWANLIWMSHSSCNAIFNYVSAFHIDARWMPGTPLTPPTPFFCTPCVLAIAIVFVFWTKRQVIFRSLKCLPVKTPSFYFSPRLLLRVNSTNIFFCRSHSIIQVKLRLFCQTIQGRQPSTEILLRLRVGIRGGSCQTTDFIWHLTSVSYYLVPALSY